MKNVSAFVILVAFVAMGSMVLESCKNQGSCGVTNISKSGSYESHNNGINCMTCHADGGGGKGCFVVAGSAYGSDLKTPLSGGTVELYTEANGKGTLKYTLAIDRRGNFYSTDNNIDYSGLWASIKSQNGSTHYMNSALGSGACNSCHGSSTSAIWAN